MLIKAHHKYVSMYINNAHILKCCFLYYSYILVKIRGDLQLQKMNTEKLPHLC